jgi:hypothetical protein
MALHTVEGARKYLTTGERDASLRAAEQADRQVRALCMTLAFAGCRLRPPARQRLSARLRPRLPRGTRPGTAACRLARRKMLQMVGAFAEFERAMIRERTSAGLAAARAEGRIGGRRKKLDETKRCEIAKTVVSGRKTAAQMARMFGVSPPTVSRIVAAHGAGT